MPVMRVDHNKNYTTMANYHLRDKNLSLSAKGLLSYILSLPDDWDYSVAGLSAACGAGVYATRSAIKELEEFGYITRTRERKQNGTLGSVEYIVREKPIQPICGNQTLDNLTLDNPILGNHTQLNNVSNQSTNKQIPPTPQGERKSRRKKCDVPTLDDVIEYATSRGRKDLAQGFFEYYNEGNWCDSKGNPVLNWKQKFITWEQRNPKPKENTSGGEKIYF